MNFQKCCRHTVQAAGDLNSHVSFAAKGKGSGGVKTAKLYAWVALQTLPEEMVISPCLLDFLEKALETIPITPVERNYAGVFVPPSDLHGPCFSRIQ